MSEIVEEDSPIEQGILFIILILSLVFNIFLFTRGHGTYSVKYELMKKHRFFRVWQPCTMAVEVCYKFFFALPFIIIGVISLLRALSNPLHVLPILVNGLIVILIIYPSHRMAYFLKNGFIWIFAVGSQIVTLLMTDSNPNETSDFIEISAIFYTANSMLFCLALLNNEKIYWDLGEGVQMCGQEVIKQVNQDWIINDKQNLPDIFDGGLYGWMSKKGTYATFLLLYFSSLVVLGIYAGVIFLKEDSSLGITGLVTTIIYDIFIMTFSSLQSDQRSITTLFVMVFAGRLLTFVFGMNYWLFGYCILYLCVGVFIGSIIIDRHFPMKFEKPQQTLQRVNALKTPEFVLLILTVEIVVLILVEELTEVAQAVTITFNEKQIPIWQFAILIVVVTWILIIYLASARILSRQMNKIRSLTVYYFGIASINEYHIYIILTYFLISVAGLYCWIYLEDKDLFLGCVFLPLIYILGFEIGVNWIRNDYAILADTEQYNKSSFKKFETKIKKIQILRHRQQRQKNKKRHISGATATSSGFNATGGLTATKLIREDSTTGFFSSKNKGLLESKEQPNIVQVGSKQTPEVEMQRIEEQKEQDSQHAIISETAEDQIKIQEGSESGEKQIPKLEDFQQLGDWRNLPDQNLTQIWGNLTPYDKTIIVLTAILLAIMILHTVIAAIWAESTSGLGFMISVLSFGSSFVYYKSAKSGNPAIIAEVIVAIVGFVLGIIFWGVKYETTYAAILWALVYIAILSLCISSGISKSIEKYLLGLMASKIIILLGFITLVLGLTYGLAASIICLGIIIATAQGLLNFYHIREHGHIPQTLKIITLVTLVGMVIGLLIAGILIDDVSTFAIFSLLMLLIFLGLVAISSLIALTKKQNEFDHPHVSCSYGEPIYRFQTENEKLKSSMNHVVLYEIATILLVIYAAITTLFFKEKYYSIYALSVFLIMQFMDVILRSIETYYFLGANRKHLKKSLIIEAFNKVKDKYMLNETEGQDSPYYLDLFEKKKAEATQATQPQQLNTLWKQTVFLKEEVIKNLEEEEKFLFFWLALIRSFLYSGKRNHMIEFVTEIQEIQDELLENGILIEAVHSSQPVEIKFKLIEKQLNSLPPMDYIIYEEIHDTHKAISKQKKKELKRLHENAEEVSKQKEEELFKQRFEEIKKAEEKQQNKIEEFQKLVDSIGSGKFTDEEFPPNETVLGALGPRVSSWRRPDVDEKFISGGGMSADDVKQGQIGDCYLISSFAVLGQKFLQKAIGLEANAEVWTNKNGAYMVRFYKFLKQVYVTIDDFLPVDSSGKWVFAKSEDKGEFWPGILEKAYAKLYGGYDKIVSGKCHQVMSEFTGGFPFEILISEYRSNPNGLWSKMMSGKQHGYLLSAGSPEHEQGDSASSKRGIVQGHAYSILDVKKVEDYKLVKLKNPHGSGDNTEWKGPFSDDSEEMKKRMRKLLNHEKKNDGIFWMTLEDFILEFKSLYICCIFEDNWKKLEPIEGEWKSTNSFGRAQNTAKAHRNIQFGITVTKRSTLFISLSQEHETALKGKGFIHMRVQRNEGLRIQKQDVSSDKLCGVPTKPTNLVTISEELILENNSYPYTFTLYISSETKENKGSFGNFKLQMYCDDHDIKVIDHQQFDLETKNME